MFFFGIQPLNLRFFWTAMKAVLIIINNFAHDLFTGLWTSTILVIYLLDKRANPAQTLLAAELHGVMRVFFWLGIFAIAIILSTGIIRFINYRSENEDDSGQIKKKILIIKHILLSAIFIGGTYLAYRWTFY